MPSIRIYIPCIFHIRPIPSPRQAAIAAFSSAKGIPTPPPRRCSGRSTVPPRISVGPPPTDLVRTFFQNPEPLPNHLQTTAIAPRQATLGPRPHPPYAGLGGRIPTVAHTSPAQIPAATPQA